MEERGAGGERHVELFLGKYTIISVIFLCGQFDKENGFFIIWFPTKIIFPNENLRWIIRAEFLCNPLAIWTIISL